MAIQIDRAVGWLPARIGRELAHEVARGSGPLSEAVLPLNRELLDRQARIDTLTRQNEALRRERDALALAAKWSHVLDGLPQCNGETVFEGINSAGFAACFNMMNPDGCCLMGTPEGCTAQMSCLQWWRELDRPERK